MATFYASYPPQVSSGGGSGVPIYGSIGLFPDPTSVPAGTLGEAADSGILYESNATIWQPIGGPGVPLSVGTFDSGTASANAAHIDSNALIMQSASATRPGSVNVSTQTFAGVKTFSSAPNLSSLTASLPLQLDGSKNITAAAIDLSGAQATGTLAAGRFPALTGDVTTVAGALGATLAATTNATLTTISSLVSVGTITTGTWNATTLAVNHGGTGQTSAAAAFAALSPLTTKGDVLGFSSANARIPVGSDGQFLTADSTQLLGVKWAGGSAGTVTSVALTVPTFLSIAGSPVTTSGTLAITLSGTALPVANGGTGLTSGTSGGILGYTASGTLASSAALPAGGVVYGGGAGVTPSATAAGTTSQVLIGGATPSFGNVPAAALPIVTQAARGAVTSAGQLLGTNTNDNAGAGFVGEYKESINIANSNVPAAGVAGDATTLTLTAGDWDLTGKIVFIVPAGTSFTVTGAFFLGINGRTGNDLGGTNLGVNAADYIIAAASAPNRVTLVVPSVRASSDGTNLTINGDTVVTQIAHLKIEVDNYTSNTPTFQGSLTARRMR